LFTSNNIPRGKYDLIVGLLGGTQHLHDYFSKDIEILTDEFQLLLSNAINEANLRMSKMSNNEFIKLLEVIGKITNTNGDSPTNVTQVNFDINDYLANRI